MELPIEDAFNHSIKMNPSFLYYMSMVWEDHKGILFFILPCSVQLKTVRLFIISGFQDMGIGAELLVIRMQPWIAFIRALLGFEV